MHHGFILFYVHAETGSMKIVMAQDMRFLAPSTSVNNESVLCWECWGCEAFFRSKGGDKKLGFQLVEFPEV